MLQKIDIDQKFKEFLATEIPPQLIKKKPGQGDLHYISGSTVIDMLNKLTNYMWDWKIEEHWVQNSIDKFNPKYDKEPKPQNPVAHVIGTLTIYLHDENGNIFKISKSAAGAKPIIGGQNEQKDIFKSAGTDALKKAASLVGIGAQLYRDEDEQEYFDMLCYEDPWTDEELDAHKADFDYLKELMGQGYAREELNEVLVSWSNKTFSDMGDLPPAELTEFVKYLKEQAAESEEASS